MIGKRDYREFLNSRNELYRERNMKQSPPSRAEALELMSRNPNLIRRPILVDGKRIDTDTVTGPVEIEQGVTGWSAVK